MIRRSSRHQYLGAAMTLLSLVACARSGNSPQMLPNSEAPAARAQKSSVAAYAITDLGTLPGETTSVLGLGSMTVGGALNNLGQGAGQSSNPSAIATLFSNGKVTNLNTLGAGESIANAINDSGQIAGQEDLSNSCSCYHAFLYSSGGMSDINSPSLFPGGSIADGINKSGQVVGLGFVAGASSFHAFLYSGGKMVDLNPLGGYQSIATSINDSGEIIGSSTGNAQTPGGSWLYVNGVITNISKTNYGVFFINNNGQIVGENGARHGTLYTNGVWSDLGNFSGAVATVAYGINRSGKIVGTAYFPVKSYHPYRPGKHVGVIFTNGAVVDLNTLITPNSGFTMTDATAINDAGQIAGDATNASGNEHAVLLTPQ
jgi:probable HAF family extracellular repeat protein